MSTRRENERRDERRRTLWAVLASLAFHLAVILIAAWIYLSSPPAPPPAPEEIEITLIEPPVPPPEQVFVDTSSPETAPPEEAAFESDRDTAAASALPAQGTEALPSQEGREQPVLELEEKQLALADPAPAPPAPLSPPASAPREQPPEPVEEKTEKAKPEDKPLRTDPDGLLARAEPMREPPRPREAPQPPAPPPSRPSFQRQTRATRLRGSIDNSGRPSVASLATPLGRYRKAISDAIGSNWYYHIGPRMDMFSYGTVSVVFLVGPDGKARNPRVISNTSNESFEIVTLESILTAEIPPIPPDVLPALEGGQIEIDFSFSIITN